MVIVDDLVQTGGTLLECAKVCAECYQELMIMSAAYITENPLVSKKFLFFSQSLNHKKSHNLFLLENNNHFNHNYTSDLSRG